MEDFFIALSSIVGGFISIVLFLVFCSAIVCILVLFVLSKTSKVRLKFYRKPIRRFFDKFDSAELKGARGEHALSNRLRCVNGYNRVILNCYVPKEDGTTTEIDVIMVHEKGVFVFESKNYSGWIFGTETQEKWTQSLRSGRYRSQKHQFYNPIMQNKAHIKWLKKYLDSLNFSIPFYSYIVFGDSCELKNITLTSYDHVVVNNYNLGYYVKSRADSLQQVFTVEQVDLIYSYLIELASVTKEQKQKHIQSIMSKIDSKTDKENENCGTLVMTSISDSSNTENAPHKNVCKTPPNQNKAIDNFTLNLAAEEILITEDGNQTIKEDNPLNSTSDTFIPRSNVNLNNRICPRCGGYLVLRTSKKGENAGEKFWGCKRFPQCRYTSKFEVNQ